MHKIHQVPKTTVIQGDTDHSGSGRESIDSHVGLYCRAAQGIKTEQSINSNNKTAAIVTIMYLWGAAGYRTKFRS